MKYIIIGFTSDINIKTNTAKIRYAQIEFVDTEVMGKVPTLKGWTEDINEATRFNERCDADRLVNCFNISDKCFISYGVDN